MNHKAFSLFFIAFFVLIFCLSTTNSRRLSALLLRFDQFLRSNFIYYITFHFGMTSWVTLVLHPWIVPTINELGMTSFLTQGLINTKENPTMDLIKKELVGATSIRRAVRQGQRNVEALHDQLQTAIDLGASSRVVAGGFICDGAAILLLLPVVSMSMLVLNKK
ncbi:uncharacterized protein LOC124888608 [Capsicum annuum]|uniref:uncharacterized protein LOC124888608 n=1 Tax=Capsicum annuum TaxID=4072 RepID=UPI001FB0662D|nr:uncharacterized protein LOC124888608 [Capsicum annuum]